jgi:thioredoxin 1
MIELQSREQLETAANAATAYPVLIWYSARWCAPCRRIDAIAVQNAATDAKFTFAHCDVDKVSLAVHLHGIDRIPTFILFHRGAEISRLNSATTSEITAWIAAQAMRTAK